MRLIDADALVKDGYYVLHRTYQQDEKTMVYETKRIEDIPTAQPEPKWIPCSERLPEENMRTICQNNAGAMMIGKYDIEFGWMFPAYFDGIVAWMPAPERYRGEGE